MSAESAVPITDPNTRRALTAGQITMPTLQTVLRRATAAHWASYPMVTTQWGQIYPLSFGIALELLLTRYFRSFDRNRCCFVPACTDDSVPVNLQTKLFASQNSWHDILWKCLGYFLLYVRCYPLSLDFLRYISSSCFKLCFEMIEYIKMFGLYLVLHFMAFPL